MSIRLEGLEQAQRMLRNLSAEMGGQAVADGLNRTGLAVERRLKVSMTKDLDRPTPFTLQGISRWRAKPGRINTIIGIKPIQAKYLRFAVKGGTLRTNLTPVIRHVYLDEHGNLKGKRQGLEQVARLIKAKQVGDRYRSKRRGKGRQSGLPPDMFIGEVFGVEGLWQRDGKQLNLLVRKEGNARRTKRWDYYGIVERTVRQRLPTDMRDVIDKALRSSQ
jgi:hypothetical protein